MRCKDCRKGEANKRYASLTPEKRAQYRQKARELHFSIRYGITVEDYERLFKKQRGRCAICRRPCEKFRMPVDHCHRTGRVRGLLCTYCNTRLAWIEEAPNRLSKIVAYLGGSDGPKDEQGAEG